LAGVPGRLEEAAAGRRNATTIVQSFFAFDHFPAAMSCM